MIVEGYTTLDWVLLVVSACSVILGLVIGYQAYRGFRRNDSRAMQYLSIGLILLTAVPFTLSFGITGIMQLQPELARFRRELVVITRASQLVGLAFITYSLYEKP